MKHSKAGKYPFPSPNCSGEWRSYRRILLAGTLFTLLFALLSRGFYHPDEHFQILEYAHLKLFGAETTDYLPWEYLHPKELEEQEVEIADDAIGQKVWETPLMEDASTSVEVVDSLDTEDAPR